MRIRVLRLTAFGPFAGQQLRLCGPDVPADALRTVDESWNKSTGPRTSRGPVKTQVSLIYEHPVVEPQVSHFMQVPLRTSVKFWHSAQASPS